MTNEEKIEVIQQFTLSGAFMRFENRAIKIFMNVDGKSTIKQYANKIGCSTQTGQNHLNWAESKGYLRSKEAPCSEDSNIRSKLFTITRKGNDAQREILSGVLGE